MTSITVMANISNMNANAQTVIPPQLTVPAGVTPAVTLETISYISYRPNPIGLGQALLINIWIEPPTHLTIY
jgi:hypothetical protein